MTQETRIHPFALWAVVIGAGASGISGVSSVGQLNSLHAAIEEQIRVAELRGQLAAQIRANRNLIDTNSVRIDSTMPREGIIRLHDGQQALIDKLIDWTGTTATKSELELAIGKMRALQNQ